MIAANENILSTPTLNNDQKKENNHDCNNFKQKAEQEITNLKLEMKKLSLRKNNMDLLLNYFKSK
ncbi:uncharacterized protein LOC112681581 [Sipha flava]|uniref:Uncharacterized protein LOC112681581 n=1 Tax=Sipha flava TaxID=143950 RepID=A0A8B8FAG8_9HEMI|nr:uncharacterized protein LOC112681581 [Sipha flava]